MLFRCAVKPRSVLRFMQCGKFLLYNYKYIAYGAISDSSFTAIGLPCMDCHVHLRFYRPIMADSDWSGWKFCHNYCSKGLHGVPSTRINWAVWRLIGFRLFSLFGSGQKSFETYFLLPLSLWYHLRKGAERRVWIWEWGRQFKQPTRGGERLLRYYWCLLVDVFCFAPTSAPCGSLVLYWSVVLSLVLFMTFLLWGSQLSVGGEALRWF